MLRVVFFTWNAYKERAKPNKPKIVLHDEIGKIVVGFRESGGVMSLLGYHTIMSVQGTRMEVIITEGDVEPLKELLPRNLHGCLRKSNVVLSPTEARKLYDELRRHSQESQR